MFKKSTADSEKPLFSVIFWYVPMNALRYDAYLLRTDYHISVLSMN